MQGEPLFRAESEAARHDAWLGRIVLIRPLSFTFLTACALVMATAIGAYFVAGQYTRKARVVGVLAPVQGMVKILAPQSGVVQGVLAVEGATVERDAPIFVVEDARANGSAHAIGAAVDARLQQRERATADERRHTLAASRSEIASLQARREGLRREREQIEREIATQATRSAIAREALARAHRLEGIGFLAPSAADRERDAALDHAARAESLQRSKLGLERDIASLEADLAAARERGEAQLAALDIQRAALGQERLERELLYRASIRAPAAGTIATVLVEPGQMVVAGTPLATIIPSESPLEAHLFSPSRSIGFVRPGQEVLLRYLAYPHQKFGTHAARVAAISRNPMLPAEMGFTPPDGAREPLYRIKAALASQSVVAYGRAEPLQAGMQVEADIQLDRRRLIEWVFEPLLGLAGRA